MKRLVATFDDDGERADAATALREVGFEPADPAFRNPFFDPAATLPERSGLLWGGLVGGLLGAALLFGLNQHLISVPRISPALTSGRYVLVFLGFGVGASIGGFLGGALGTVRQMPNRDRPQIAVTAPEHRVDEAEDLLHSHGAIAVDGVVTHHTHPQRSKAEKER